MCIFVFHIQTSDFRCCSLTLKDMLFIKYMWYHLCNDFLHIHNSFKLFVPLRGMQEDKKLKHPKMAWLVQVYFICWHISCFKCFTVMYPSSEVGNLVITGSEHMNEKMKSFTSGKLRILDDTLVVSLKGPCQCDQCGNTDQKYR